MKTYFIKTFGCQMNKSDSERIERVLIDMGLNKAKEVEKTDLVVVNTCSVRQSAEDRAMAFLKKFKKLGKFCVVIGCCASKDPEKFEKWVDLVLDIKDLQSLPNLLQGKKKKISVDYFKLKPEYETKFHAYVPIMTGCNNFCSYCAVPYARGREVSRSVKDIIDEIKGLIKNGYKAITLLGQNVNSYKSDKTNFPALLKKINDVEGDFWLWFLTSHPKDMNEKLIRTIAKCEKVCPYIHLAVQSGNNEILKAMNRGYTREKYIKLVKLIKLVISDVCLTTDIIVGFPGETREQFKDTVKLFKEIKFDMAYISQYSKRPKTAAAQLENNISLKEKKRRWKVLTDILKKTGLENNKKYIGKTVEVLVEKPGIGKTRSFKTVKFKGDEKLVGQIVKIKIKKVLEWGLQGKIC